MMQQLHASSSCTGRACGRAAAPRGVQRVRVQVVARSGGNGTENGKASAEKQREIAKMLLATQRNMLELNNSRVKVAEELAMANRRIADLERELERMRAEAARQQLNAQMARTNEGAGYAQGSSGSTGGGVATAAPPATDQYQQQQQQQQQQPVQQQPVQQQQQPVQQQQQQPMQQQQQPPSQQAPPAATGTIQLTYISGWHNCFIHYTTDGKTWTAVPGLRMTTSKRDHATKTATIEGASKLEFVMTNGENDWDSPGRFSDKPKNYAITSPGAYRLAKGKLERTGDAVAEPPQP